MICNEGDCSQYQRIISVPTSSGKSFPVMNTFDFLTDKISGILKDEFFFLDETDKALLSIFGSGTDSGSSQEDILNSLKKNLLRLNETYEKKLGKCLKGTFIMRDSHVENHPGYEYMKMYLNNKFSIDGFLSHNNLKHTSQYIDSYFKLSVSELSSISISSKLLFSGIPESSGLMDDLYHIKGLKLTLDSSYIVGYLNNDVCDDFTCRNVRKFISDSAFDNHYFYPNLENYKLVNDEIFNVEYESKDLFENSEHKRNLKNDILEYFDKLNTLVEDKDIFLLDEEETVNKIFDEGLLSEEYYNSMDKFLFKKFLYKYFNKLISAPERITRIIDILVNILCNSLYKKTPELLVTRDKKVVEMAYLIKDFLSHTNISLTERFQSLDSDPTFYDNYEKVFYSTTIPNGPLFHIIEINNSSGGTNYLEI